MWKFIALVLILWQVENAHAQRKDPIGRLIFGLETGFDVKQYHDDIIPRVMPGIQAEYSFWRFSLGVGLMRKYYHEYQYVYYNGKYKTEIIDDQPVITYYYDVKGFKPAYWTVPLKVNFRLHSCNCVYAHAAIQFEFLNTRPAERVVFTDAQSKDPLPYGVQRSELMHKQLTSYEFGLGFKLFTLGTSFRVYARPTYVVSQKPEVYVSNKYGSTLRMTFGAQYGFFN